MSQRPTVESLHKSLEEIRTELQRATEKPMPDLSSARIAFAHLKRVTNVVKAVLLVSKNGLGAEVGALGRIVTEAAYYVMWMELEKDAPRTAAERERCAGDILDAYELHSEMVKRTWVGRGFGSQQEADDARKRADAILAKRGVKEFKLPPIEQLATAIGKAAHENYDLFYRMNCIDAHATLASAIKAIQGGDDLGHERNLFMTIAASLVLMQSAYKLMGCEADYAPVDAKVQGMLGIRAALP